jgi:multicomponent Na+:H+ antiporter subunit C
MSNQLDAAMLVALLVGAGIYLFTSRRLLRVMFGFFVLSNAVNIVLIGVSGDPDGRRAPVLSGDPGVARVDPLPQALILTAIVIGFAVAAYLAVLVYRIYTDRHRATVPSVFHEEPGAGSPAACEQAADAASRQAEQAAAERRHAAADREHGHAGKGGHS